MNLDLFGNPIPQASIGGPQGYLMDTRPDAHPQESAKLAKLRAAATKDAPVLLEPNPYLESTQRTLSGCRAILADFYPGMVEIVESDRADYLIVLVSGTVSDAHIEMAGDNYRLVIERHGDDQARTFKAYQDYRRRTY